MMTKIMYTFLAVVSCVALQGQSIAPAVLASSGGSGSSADHHVEWTMGEMAIATIGGGDNVLTQGFHQPELIITGTFDANPDISMEVFPNPSTDVLYLRFDPTLSFECQLVDMKGVLMVSQTVSGGQGEIMTGILSPGHYMLSLLQEGSLLKTYIIEKAQ